MTGCPLQIDSRDETIGCADGFDMPAVLMAPTGGAPAPACC
jgi:hypothetical protein